MATFDRRLKRSNELTLAFQYQLAACCADGGIAAMSVADDDGVPLAEAGQLDVGHDVLRRVASIARRIQTIEWTVLGAGRPWDVSMRKLSTDRGDLVVRAVGGGVAARRRAIERTVEGVARIVAAPL